MADNIELNAGTGGATLATDDAGAAGHVQVVKLAIATDGSATAIPAEATNGLDVDVTRVQGTVTVDGSGVTQPVSNAGLTELAAAINASSQMDVNIAASAATVAVSNAGLTELAAAIDTEVQCDIVGALPAGANAIGKLAANSGVDIGDVDVTSIVSGTGATNLGKAEDGGHTTGDVGVMALAVRNDTPNAALAGADLDYSPIGVYKDGALRLAPPSSDFAVLGSTSVKKYYTNAGAVTDGIVWSPAAGTRWYVTDIIVNVSAAATVTFEDDKAGGDEAVAKFEFAANSGVAHSFSTPWASDEDAADLLVTTTAGNIYITITGYEV